MKVLGIELVDYVSRKTNQPVKGVNLHLMAEKGSDNRVNGSRVATIFISSRFEDAYSSAQALPLDSNVNIFYNQFGNACGVQVLK